MIKACDLVSKVHCDSKYCLDHAAWIVPDCYFWFSGSAYKQFVFCSSAVYFAMLHVCRAGNVLVNGTIGTAAITLTGDGDVYVVGTTTSVAVNSSGDGDIKLRNANGKTHHVGSAVSGKPPPPSFSLLLPHLA